MNTVTGITSQPKQQLTVVLDDRSQVFVYLEYRPQQSGWFMNLSWGSWSANGLRVTAAPNMLRQYQKLIPFGLAVITKNNVEPLNVTDFADGTATAILLNSEDVQEVNSISYQGF